MSTDWKDPRRIALIAVRTGSGAPPPNSAQPAQAIVVGEVPVDPNGVIVDPNDHQAAPSFTYEWRYACFSLAQLQELQNAYKSAAAKNASWQDIVHPLDGSRTSALHPLGLQPYGPQYYLKPGVIPTSLLIGNDEKNDLLAADDLPANLITQLNASINPYIDDAGTQSATAVPLLNFVLPLRDVVRLAIYDKDNQPFTAPFTAQDKHAPLGPLTVLDTCRFVVAPNGTSAPLDPTDLINNKIP